MLQNRYCEHFTYMAVIMAKNYRCKICTLTNFLTLQKTRTLKIGVPIELHAKSVYTRAMYNKFEEQLFKSGSFAVLGSAGDNKFLVRNAIKGGKSFNVTIDTELSKIDCCCGYMTHIGMPCCHALKVRNISVNL
jgi:hypothetical protein